MNLIQYLLMRSAAATGGSSSGGTLASLAVNGQQIAINGASAAIAT